MTRHPYLALLLAACATGGSLDDDAAPVDESADAAPPAEVDAAADPDAPAAVLDAAVVFPPDAAAPSPDAAVPPPDAAAPDACVPEWIELLGNGGFDTGVAPWTQSSAIVTADADMPITPQAGGFSAWLGGANNQNDLLVQEVSVPAGASMLRVVGYECFVTSSQATGTDTFLAQLTDGAGTPLETLRTTTNAGVGTVCAWTLAVWMAADAHAGETVRLSIRGTTDASFPTSFYLDTLALQAYACP